jgi:hypothetical protein
MYTCCVNPEGFSFGSSKEGNVQSMVLSGEVSVTKPEGRSLAKARNRWGG